MPPIPGSVRITGFIAPTDDTDTYPVTDETYNKGGFRAVANNAELIGIPALRRKEGMLVFQLDTGEFWQLIGGIADINWTPCSFGKSPNLWVTNTVETEMFASAGFPYPAGPGSYHSGYLYVNYVAGTLLSTQWPYYLLRINTPAGAIPRLMFGREMNGGIMDWVAEGFGIALDGNMTAPNFTNLAKFIIGWKDFAVCTEDASDYIVFEKKQGDIKLYASVSTARLGGHHFTVDTGLTWDQDYCNKYEIVIDPIAMTADFYRWDVGLVAHIDSDDVPWPDALQRPWQFEGPSDMSLVEWPILYQFPWLVSMHK